MKCIWIPVLALVICSACGDNKSPPAADAARGLDKRQRLAGALIPDRLCVRLLVSELPSFDPITGGQWCGIYWTSPAFRLRPNGPPRRGQLSVWVLDGLDWALVDVFNYYPGGEEANSPMTLSVPQEKFYARFSVQSVRDVVAVDPSGNTTLDLTPCREAIVRLVAGSKGTPAWDSPVAAVDKDGVVRFGPMAGDLWYADVSARGHCPIRMYAPFVADQSGDNGWIPIYPSVRRTGKILVRGKPPPPGTTLLVALPRVTGSLDVYYPIRDDGTFLVEEPLKTQIDYTVTLPDGRTGNLSRLTAADSPVIQIE